MKTVATIVASVSITFLAIAYAPLWFWDLLGPSQAPNFGGTSITTILGTDTLSASRTTINNNFSSLNTNKLEIENFAATTSHSQLSSLASLVTVGTITSGTWNGSIIGVPYGGTGSSTPSSNQLLLGNGSSAIKTVAGYGTSGQTLTSNGTGAAPTWQSVTFDTTQNYTLTGLWTFKATTTLATTTIQGATGGLVPSGAVTAYASSSAPTGWLTCNGQAVSRAVYADLFAAIGTVYGVGDGSTTFNVPDLRGRNPLMASSTANMAQSAGESNHTMTISELVAHTHTYDGNNGAGAEGWSDVADLDSGGKTTGSTGGTTPFNVLDPYLTVWYIIKT